LYITAGRVLLGLTLGGIAGWREGSWYDRMFLRVSAIIASIPLLLSAMLMILALDIKKGLWVFVVSLSLLGWTEIGQLVRGEFIRIKELLFIEAAEALGLSRAQIIIRHALPNVLSYLMTVSFLEMGAVLLIMAELGFLGLFVGGGSRYRSDPFSPVIIQISEVPEWGALVAQGTPYLRSYPYMVLGPAGAFFISILGLNAFGEGLRRIFNRWPFSTAFILKKRMLVLIAAFVGISAFIFQKTNAVVSYQRVAESFSVERAADHVEQLKSINTIAHPDQDNPVVDYVIDVFKNNEIQPGWSETLNSFYYNPLSTTLVQPLMEPRLQVGYRDRYHYRNEFSFRTGECAGSGVGEGPVVFLGGPTYGLGENLFKDQVDGNILMLLEESVSTEFPKIALSLGAEGILLVSREQPPLTSQFETDPEETADTCAAGEIPVFVITAAVARNIAAEAGLDWDQLQFRSLHESFIQEFNLPGVMDISLSEPQIVEVPNIIGFIGGYDIDHADEIVVVYTTFDGLGLSSFQQNHIPVEDIDKIAALLEVIRTWNDHQLDPRRSVLFVLWGGEGIEGPFFDLFYGLYEKNSLAAKVPTNMNPYLNTNPVKPAYWVEIGDLSTRSGTLAYATQSTPSLARLVTRAGNAANLPVASEDPRTPGVNSGLPNLYIWEEKKIVEEGQSLQNFTQKGVLINRTLVQLVRKMEN
jgi:ABC-type dipeptide/oligopeptide/nickel transport system permease subunit